jgi:uncharacterized protein (DUF885 family)/dipeptidyl aminopeptidase/acylaminoacyl peptidase
MKVSMHSSVLLLVLLYVSSVAAQTTAPPVKRFDLDSTARLVRLSDPQISPDGKSIAIVVSRANYQDNRWESELALVEIATGTQRVLTHERRDVRQPRWTASGDRLAFVAGAMTGKESKPQVFVLPMNGGEALRVTSAPNGVQHFAWKPDGREIAFVTADDSTNKKIGDREIAFEVGHDHFLTNAAATSSHIWLTPSNVDQARRLTSGEWSLPPILDLATPSPLSWSPDGKSIAIVKQATAHAGDGDQRSVQILDVASGATRALTGNSRWESQPLYSPDGSRIAYLFPRDGVRGKGAEMHVTSAEGGAGLNVTQHLDRNIYRAIWMPGSRSLLVGGNDGTRGSLWLQAIEGSARRLEVAGIIPGGNYWIDASVANDGAIVLTGSQSNRPVELYYMSSVDAIPKRLTDFNGSIAALPLGKVERVEWTNDGYSLDGVLTIPADFSPSGSYPLVLVIHGGPNSASKESFAELPQLMAARGWIVFEPNYRGSDNLGARFQYAIHNDAGDGPGRDVMSGIEMLKSRRYIDTSRMAVTGRSYGGYMTAWLTGHYHVWKAAVAGASVTDWVDQYNLGDYNASQAERLGGSPWTGDFEKAYREQSPITFARQSKTPTLILSTTGDVRVPITQSYKLYHALRDNQVPVQFIAYPVGGHSPSDPVRQQDMSRRMIEWLEKYLSPATTTPAEPSLDKFLDTFAAEWMRGNPQAATTSQYFEGAEQDALDRQLTPITADYRHARVALAQRGLAALAGFDRGKMTDSQRISTAMFEWQLKEIVDSEPFADFSFPFDQFRGLQVSLVNFLSQTHPIRTGRDIENYLARLEQVAALIDEGIAQARERGERGILPPKFILTVTIDQIGRFLAPAPRENVLVASLAERSAKIQDLPAEQRDPFIAAAEKIVAGAIIPAFGRAQALLQEQLPKATDDAGLWRLPRGSEAYANALHRNTSTTLTADQIHETGLKEVARIEQQMDALLRRLGYTDGSVKDRMARLEADSQPKESDPRPSLLAEYTRIVRDAERRSATMFDLRPKALVEVRREPEFTEKNAAAHYSAPAPDGSRPGVFWVPLPGPSYEISTMRTLAYHEAVPGHHFQIALQREMKELPLFRRKTVFGGIASHAEGWALYAERLAAESGWYEDDLRGRLGQLDDELFRARRLVVDTGLHARHWTRQQAIDYGIRPAEVERYVVVPGQACAYKIGQLKILELREKVKTALGGKFSLKEFHNLVLRTGNVPLDVLELAVDMDLESRGVGLKK